MDTVGPQEIDVLCTTTMANQQPQLRSLLLQQLGNMAADKPGCTSDESFHERSLDWIIALSGSRDGREGSQHAALGVRTAAGWEDNQNDSQAPAARCFRGRRRNCLLAERPRRLLSALQLPYRRLSITSSSTRFGGRTVSWGSWASGVSVICSRSTKFGFCVSM